ncbi:MAG TPA: hypothetical protein VLM16_08030 [Ginsengibacter sp.]|nr:hypothetical protein [Ginsengibacter sp.]
MKQIKLLLLLTVLFSVKLTAQTYRIDSTNISFENKLRPCFEVNYDADPKTVKKAWSKFLDKKYKIKTKGIGLLSDKDLITARDVTINTISDKRMDMYASITDISGGCNMKYFMSFGYDFFIGPDNYSKEFEGMKSLLNDFSVEFLNKYYGDETSRILKQIKRYERDIKKDNKVIKKNVRKSRKASSAEATGLEARNNTHSGDISNTQEKIKDLQRKLEEIKVKQGGITRN